jgi:transposase InsO family protein
MKWPSLYLKMRVLGAVDTAPGRTKEERLKHVAGMTFSDEDGIPRQFTWRSIQTWLWCYTKLGFMSLQNKARSDKGQLRKVSREQLVEAIDQVLPSFRDKHPKKSHVYKACVERGLLCREKVAPNTFSRLVNELELLKPDSEAKHRQAFSKQFANQMWQVDTMFGPYVQGKQTKLIAFIDDASRVLCHGEFFFQENTDTFLSAFRSALYKRGLPEQIYADNGAIYSCKELLLVCSRLGIILSHAPVRDGAAKGKIERFFRHCREAFLSRNLDLSSLESLNRAFISWVEDDYNCHFHSVLQMKPIDRFGLDLKRIRFLAISEATDELFFVEEDRLVRADNTFSLKNIRFESPAALHNRQIQVRFDRKNFGSDKVIVYYKLQRIGPARPVDFTANDRAPNPTTTAPSADQPINNA